MVTYANNYDSYTCIVAGKIVPFETGVGEGYFVSRPVDQRPKGRNLPSLTDRVGRHKSGYRRRVHRIICCFDEPSGDIVERLPAFRERDERGGGRRLWPDRILRGGVGQSIWRPQKDWHRR